MKKYLNPAFRSFVLILFGFVICSGIGNTPPDRAEVAQFVADFTNQLTPTKMKVLRAFVDTSSNKDLLISQVSTLTGKTGLGIGDYTQFRVSVIADTSRAGITMLNNTTAVATIQVTLHVRFSDTVKKAPVRLTIRKSGPHQYKITDIDFKQFGRAYNQYENWLSASRALANGSWEPITLAAFKTAARLKQRYDSVLYFDHIHHETYYYVMNGYVDGVFPNGRSKAGSEQTYGIGLVDPKLKEVIPPAFDLIHNIGGTVNGLVEVEKNGKRGLYNLQGKSIVPVSYDQIYALNDTAYTALLLSGNNYFYLKKDNTISPKIKNFRIADLLSKIKDYSEGSKLVGPAKSGATAYNSKIVPIGSDQIHALKDTAHKQLTPRRNNYSYLKKGNITSAKIADSRMKNLLSQITDYDEGIKFGGLTESGTMAYNSRYYNNTITFPASYLVDWGLTRPMESHEVLSKNDPKSEKNIVFIRKEPEVIVTGETNNDDSWFSAAFHDLVDNFLGGRTLFYQRKNVILVDKQKNKISAVTLANSAKGFNRGFSTDQQSPLKVVGVNLLEYKTTSDVNREMIGGTTLAEIPYYHYLYLNKNTLAELPNNRAFAFTRYVQLDSTYLTGQFWAGKSLRRTLDPELLEYAKNEIYASYLYQFPDERWQRVFQNYFNRAGVKHFNTNVDDSLSIIEKYNIDWINRKIKTMQVGLPTKNRNL